MLPDNLVPGRYHYIVPESPQDSSDTPSDFTLVTEKLQELEVEILSSVSQPGRIGLPKNALLEEHDRYFKERLFSVAKIETFARVLKELVAENEITQEALSELITQKTVEINEQGEKIWLNLITSEIKSPLFYRFED
ncbi:MULTISPECIES: hypothetical protein [Mangrovibacter]|uniref:Uncharacterized protein n=1 Tax=Mangrovibacter plantisponsor TaxID=451513 RepID=A0A317QAG7_9ENTR|nr:MULTISPECIES: hypothetical protein [Mangrovibacter]KEA53487.1 hypothetical protein DT73_06660 [Mangrovibacter sp. MFB070]PWW12916.1 hypothetical protein DES37_101493 [Mangrovibacter plantisponsor]